MSLMWLLLSSCLFVIISGSPKSLFADISRTKDASIEKTKLKPIEEYSDEELFEELNELIGNLNEDQLKSLEEILDEEDLDDKSEFKMIAEELREIGMDEEDIQDLKNLTNQMHEYLMKVPNIDENLKLTKEMDLQDHIQLYLLGLPNRLGPLGFISLHHVLEENEDLESVKATPAPLPDVAANTHAAVETVSKPMSFRRKRQASTPSSTKPNQATSSPTKPNLSTSKPAPPSAPSGAQVVGGGKAFYRRPIPAKARKVGGNGA